VGVSKLDEVTRWERESDAQARRKVLARDGGELEAWRVFMEYEGQAPEGQVCAVDQWAQTWRERGFGVRVYQRDLRVAGFYLPVIVAVVTAKEKK
jgi:hypothetical protein